MDTPAASARPSHRSSDLRSAIGWTVCSTAGLVAAWASYDFGAQIGGAPMGVVAALNGALMGGLLASAVMARLLPPR